MLFNTKLFGTGMFNGGQTIATMFSTDLAVFEGFSLSDGTNMILSEMPGHGPSREITGGNVTRGDGMYITGSNFRERIIELTGYVKRPTKESLNAYLDTIRQNLTTQEGSLDITEDGNVKRYIATCTNFDTIFAERRHFHLTICPFTIRFSCRTPFGLSRDYDSVFNSFTTSPSNQSVVSNGTFKSNPVFVLSFNAASSVTSVSILNTTTGETISFSGAIATNDILIFDCEEKSVTLNGTAVDFSGLFPSLAVGTNLIQFTINGTFTVGITSKNPPTFI